MNHDAQGPNHHHFEIKILNVIMTFFVLRTLASRWNKQKFRCYEAKIEESEKAGSRRESNPGHLACNTWQPPSMYRQNSTPNGVLTVHTGCQVLQLRHSSPTCAVHIEDCGGWWLSGCRSSVVEHWLHKPGVLGSIPGGCRPFHFPLFPPHNI